ncbi:ABC-type antimicrobial peptide transport system, permease component [Candidatus Magnetoovum chiemensis]|nr:ABC-type antimicrobial peptide transport system, permease component [Candidatus Magnetoovum chiemensis]
MQFSFVNLTLTLKIALKSLSNFKLRTALAVTGIVLGTLSLITVTNISNSLKIKTLKEISKMGRNLLVVRSGFSRGHGSTKPFSAAQTLNLFDMDALINSTFYVKSAAPASNKAFPVRYKNNSLTTTLTIGTTTEFFPIRNIELTEGRFFNKDEIDSLSKVVVIGSKVAKELFPLDENPIGKYIYIWRAPCKVIGVMKTLGVDMSNFDQDDVIYMPLSTFMSRFVKNTSINMILVQAVNKDALLPLKSSAEPILRKRHNIKAGEKDDFTVIDMRDIASLETQTMDLVKLLGLITSGLSFIISSIGILSIMILIVNERKTEIGLRRALGSTKRDIVTQFLTESSFISVSGGVVGLVLAVALTSVICIAADLPFTISPFGLAVSFAAAVFIGIVSGIYPSLKAVDIAPVDVLKG